jgi:hypothetical protein
LLLGAALYVLYFYREAFFQLPDSYAFAMVAVVGISPVLYFVVGLIYQGVSWTKEKITLLRYSSSLEHDFETSATVCEIEKGKDSPVALSTGLSSYIFIPSELIEGEMFDQKEIEAIVAHEEKHIRSREALLFFYIPLLSFLLFTGQNVIYSLLNFREREFQADKYAKEKVGEEAIISALQKAKLANNIRDSESSDLTWWQNYFGLFYGTFAHSEAHPDLDERIHRLRQEG